ncbi:hypothetical protein ONS95_010032 [Cadophora gregata]|uniref:uncharacterized protein n=1 Tax=Cadophora gregata TaxID=51156 RepID=UPI0026DD328C|nr:uncharacterized protein ONS95_010032 [Cadophora gregata]KAK0121746.1 hypothetical protein ONS95_010032 [Cadophora gregata]
MNINCPIMSEMNQNFSSRPVIILAACNSLQTLHSDVLVLICQLLCITCPQSLKDLGRTCRRLHHFTVAFEYRILHLNSRLLITPMSPSLQRYWDNVHCHARHISILENLDWEIALPLLRGCQTISVIDWGVWGERDGYQRPETSRIPKLLQDVWPRAHLRLMNYPWPSKLRYNMYTYTLPTENIVYISTKAMKIRKRDFGPLGQVISNSLQLKLLHLDSMRGDQLWTGRRTPPIRELMMWDCTWTFTKEETNAVWDFSQLQILDISGIDCAKEFFNSISGDSLNGLRKLVVTGKHDVRWGECCSAQLNDLISRSHLLEELEIDCDLTLMLIESIYRHAYLNKLKIHDFRGFGKDNIVCPTLTVGALEGLLATCPRLRHLSLDLDWTTCNVEEFLRILARFLNLQYLNLRMRSRLHELGGNSTSFDTDLEAVKQHVYILGSNKEGLGMITITIRTAGYNELTDRRTAEWDLQRKQGHIPERCFVFSWSEGGLGLVELSNSQYRKA